VAGLLAQSINLPGIVGAFLAGLAVNAAVRDKPAKEKLEFFGNSFFIPIFFVVTGFLIDPVVFFQSITTNFPLVSAVIGALLVGKWIAATNCGSRLWLYSSRADDDVVAHVAAGGGDTGGHVSRLRYSKPRRSTSGR
jgi:Kef-type K+ transport system membrane component KefB